MKIGSNENLLILREQGIGEEILFSSVYQDIIESFENIKIEADKRLVSRFNRSFENDIFFGFEVAKVLLANPLLIFK